MTRILPLILLATGCAPNIGWRDHDPGQPHFLGKRNDHLSGPYAQGSTLSFWIDAGRKLQGWTVTSSDPSVYEVLLVSLEDGKRIKVVGTALGEGTAELELHKPNGKLVESIPIEVHRPDRFELRSLALLKIGSEAVLDDVQILATRDVTLAITPHAGDQLLGGDAGITVQEATSTPDLEVRLETREGADHPTYLRLDAPAPLERTVPILWNDTVVLEPTVTAVEDDAIASVTLEGSEQGFERGDYVRLLASARDAQGRRILGPSASWSLAADPTVSVGDLYVYELAPNDPNTLLARIGEHEVQTSILGRGAAEDSADIGCSTTSAPIGGWLALAGLLALRRRSRGA